MSTDDVRVEISDEAADDIRSLAGEDEAAALEVMREIKKLGANPHLGSQMDARPPRILEPCRKLYLGPHDMLGRPTLRVIYVNEPEDGAPQVALVIAVGERKDMRVHRQAARRLKRRRGA